MNDLKLEETPSYTAFEGTKKIAQGLLEDVVIRIKKRVQNHPSVMVQVFSDLTGKEMDFNMSGTMKEVLDRLHIYRSQEEKPSSPHSSAGPGRPRLGVIAREISLLPRHWEWLSSQSGGASATLRRLIEEARKNSSGKNLLKEAQERTYKFMHSMAGNLPEYEEALRALYQKDFKKLTLHIAKWPVDIQKHIKKLAAPIWKSL